MLILYAMLILQDSELERELTLERVSIDEILEAQRLEQEKVDEERKRKEQILRERGLPLSERTEDVYS